MEDDDTSERCESFVNHIKYIKNLDSKIVDYINKFDEKYSKYKVLYRYINIENNNNFLQKNPTKDNIKIYKNISADHSDYNYKGYYRI